MVVAFVVLVLEIVVVALGDIDLTAYDGLDFREVLCHFEELLHSVHISVVCDGNSGHTELRCSFEKPFDRRKTVKDGILGVDVKVDE